MKRTSEDDRKWEKTKRRGGRKLKRILKKQKEEEKKIGKTIVDKIEEWKREEGIKQDYDEAVENGEG